MPEIVTDFQPFENPKKPLKTMAHCDIAPRFLPTKKREDPGPIVAKFGDHLPFYRQAEIYARQGVILDRATLGNWAGRACFHLEPIADHMSKRLASADHVFMDETTGSGSLSRPPPNEEGLLLLGRARDVRRPQRSP